MELSQFLFYVVAGAGVGLAMGCTGIGGGSLMTPILLAVGIPPQVAVGTDLLYASVTKVSGLISHQRRGNIDWRVMGLMSLGSVPAAFLTVIALDRFFTDSQSYASLLTDVLGVMLIITAVILILRGPLVRLALRHDAWVSRRAPTLTVLSGILLGICVTLSSVGAGVFGTAVLMLLYARFAPRKIVGTDIAHAVPLTFVAGTGHLFLGNIDFALLAALLVGSIPAIHFGAVLAQRMPEALLRWILTLLLLGLGLRYALL